MVDGQVPRIIVVGGGISGLAAAHRLLELASERQLPVEVRLLEAGTRVGGVIETGERDGFLLEGGPESFITDKPWALTLCNRLGLSDDLIGTNPTYRRSFIAWGGRLLPIPEGFQLLAPSRLRPIAMSPLFSPAGKLRMALEAFVPPRAGDADESVAAFVRRRLGQEALERLAQPLVGGIYGADPRSLSLLATLPRFRKMEQEHGSLLNALRARRRQRPEARGVSGARYGLFVTLRRGMQSLVDALASRLPEGSVQLGARVVGIGEALGAGRWALGETGSREDPAVEGETPGTDEQGPARATRSTPNADRQPPNADRRFSLSLADGSRIEADGVCLAVPAHAAAGLAAGLDGEIASLLGGIPYASAGTLNLAYARHQVPHPLDGFGFVVPAAEGRSILGCTFSSVKFPGRAPEGMALLRAFFGGGLAGREDAELEAAARADLKIYLGITAAPLWTELRRWPRAMPHYAIGHLDRVAAIRQRVEATPGLALAGNAFSGVGIPDCIHTGEQAAESIVEDLFPGVGG